MAELPIPFCGRCWPTAKSGKSYALRDPMPDDCPLPHGSRFYNSRMGFGVYWMCDDCAKEGERWFVQAAGA